ncbi:glycoside hydrolase family 19 protein, partial [Mycolicibacterium houstonense]|uniref:glycoside hydrolase family 19 protein n=1 Tax=Mycolicibacterium houstonense TaxID=146021 RepID=UPI00082EC6EA
MPRVVNGNSFTENGWPMASEDEAGWVRVPGTNVTLQIQKGQPTSVMRAFAADFNEYVEPLRDADSACWTRTNDVLGQPGRNNGSNHLGGTGMDLNWNGADGRTFRLGISEERAYPGDKARKLRELLEWYEGMIFCGGAWSIRDWMHFQMGGNTYNNPCTANFIARKIRADGFSTFRRGNAPVSAAPILAAATGLSEQRAAEILPAVAAGLRESEATSVNRIAMWLAQVGHESVSFKYTEEIASGAAYEGRCRDLGNCQPGDGVRFKGRSWIQITGRHNYGEFSRWTHAFGLVNSPTYFVDRPTELGELRWAGVGAAWYWTVARGTRINEAADRRDIVTVTQLINGGQNGIWLL